MTNAFMEKMYTGTTRLVGTAIASALLLSLGLLAAPTAAQAGVGPICSGTIIVVGPTLCGSSDVPGADGSTTFNYDFEGGSAESQAYIPLLDPNAITAGSFTFNSSPDTPTIITGAAVAADWGTQSFADGKSIFDDPVALIDIALPPGLITDISFSSDDPVVSGPILVGSAFYDPPLPGPAPVPEPSTLGLLGSALAGFGIYRLRRKAA